MLDVIWPLDSVAPHGGALLTAGVHALIAAGLGLRRPRMPVARTA